MKKLVIIATITIIGILLCGNLYAQTLEDNAPLAERMAKIGRAHV